MFLSRSFISLSTLCAIAILITGCGGQDAGQDSASGDAAAQTEAQAEAARMTPTEVAQAFMDAGDRGDRETFKSYLTEAAREAFGEDDGPSADDIDSFTVGESTIDGESAEVNVLTIDDEEELPMVLKMRDENGAWRIHALTVDMGEGFKFTMDFEQIEEMMDSMVESMGEALSESFQAAFETSPEELEAQRARYESLSAVSAESLEAGYLNGESFEGVTAAEAVRTLAASIGLVADFGEHEAAMAGTVGAGLSGLSAVEAIERIAAGAGVYPVFPEPSADMGLLGGMAEALAEGMTEMLEQSGVDMSAATADADEAAPNALRFEAGTRPYPVSFAGPFVFEVTEVQEEVPNARGQLSLAIRAYGLPGSVGMLLEEDMNSTHFETIADAQGRSLKEDGVSYLGGGETDGISYADYYSPELLNLLQSVTTIAKVEGIQRLRRPDVVQEFVFENIAEGQTASAGDLTAEVKKVGDYTSVEIATGGGDAMEMAAFALALDPDGNPIEITFLNAMGWQADSLQVDINLAAAPTAVRIKVVTSMDIREYPFAFADIPLRDFADQPEKLLELSYEGYDAPLTIEFVEVVEPDESFAKVNVRIINHGNKDVAHVFANFVYLDANGGEIDDFPTTINSAFKFVNGESVTEPVAAAGATQVTETTAFNMPPEAKGIRVEINSMEFTDGTEWESE